MLLQVEAYRNHPPTSEQDALAIERLEKALQLEPRSVEAMVALSKVLLRPLMQFGPDETTKVRVRRAQNLIDEARKIAPDIRHVLDAQAVMLVTEGRWDEAQSAYRHLLDRYPDDVHLLNQVAICSIVLGRSEEALPLLRKAVSLGPDDPWAFTHEANLGLAFVRLGRDGEAVEWLRRAKQDAPVVPASVYSLLAAAYAQLGRIDDAHRELAAYIAKEPWVTVRWLRHRRRSSEVAVAERTREIDGLAKAGLRDHAEEDADGGLAFPCRMSYPGSSPATNSMARSGIPSLRR